MEARTASTSPGAQATTKFIVAARALVAPLSSVLAAQNAESCASTLLDHLADGAGGAGAGRHGRLHLSPGWSSASAAVGPQVPASYSATGASYCCQPVAHGIDERPLRLHLVGAGEEGGVAAHGVEDEPLVGLRRAGAELGPVAEVHRHVAHGDALAGHLGGEAQGDALVRLDAHDEEVGLVRGARHALEEAVRQGLELDGHLGDALGEALAGAQVEGDPAPAPRVERHAQRDEGLVLGARRDVGLGAVARHLVAAHGAGGVLPAHREAEHLLLAADGVEGAQHLDLLVAHGVGVPRGGRLHGGEREDLERVVLHDVARGAHRLVEAAAPLDADVLGDGDLHVVDVLPRPQRLEDGVAEAEHHQVLHGLFAEVVIDPVDLALGEVGEQIAVEGAGAGEIDAEGLLHDDVLVGRALLVRRRHHQARLAQAADDGGDLIGADREVEDAVFAGAALAVEALQLDLELGERLRQVELALHVGDALGQLGPRRLVHGLAPGELGDALLHLVGEVGLGPPRHAHHGEAAGEHPAQRQVVDRGHQLALGEVARGAEDDEGAGAHGAVLRHALAQGVLLGGVRRRRRRGHARELQSVWTSPSRSRRRYVCEPKKSR